MPQLARRVADIGAAQGDLAGAFSRRINIHNPLVYEVFSKERTVRVLHVDAL